MSNLDKIEAIKKLGGWERLVIFSGVILSVPLFTLLGTAIYAVATDRSDAPMGVLLSVVAILVLWAIVWGLLWIFSGFQDTGFMDDNGNVNGKLKELQQENERLKRQLEELRK